MRAAECLRVGGNLWFDPKFPTFGGYKEVKLFAEELQGSKHQDRLGECYYFNARDIVEKKKSWTEWKSQRKCQRKRKPSRKGKEPEVVRPPNESGGIEP